MDNQNKLQKLCNDLVNREVIYSCSILVEKLCQNDEFIDELMEVCHKTVKTYDVYDENDVHCKEFNDEDDAEEYVEKLGEGFHVEENEEEIEALEHWIVSDWLGDRLEAQGEMVIEFNGLRIWGRTISGQSIAIDSVFTTIAKDMQR